MVQGLFTFQASHPCTYENNRQGERYTLCTLTLLVFLDAGICLQPFFLVDVEISFPMQMRCISRRSCDQIVWTESGRRSIPRYWQVLEVGCGNSQMGEEIYKDGFTRITRTDLSPVAIDRMRKRSVARGCEGFFGTNS